MAHSQSLVPQSSSPPGSKLSKKDQKVMRQLASGYSPAELAAKHADTPKEIKKLRNKYRRLAARPEAMAMAMEMSQGTLHAALVPATDALTKRAMRGRVDAIKLIYEVTGYHNPRVKHEHSGDITISLKGVPRPTPVDTVDSTVVEDAEEA